MPNVMLSFGQEPTAAINAYGGAADGTAIKLHEACTAANSDCTWTFSKGELISDTDSTLALNAYGGASDGGLVLLNQACTSDNPDCTWTWTQGQLVSDNQSAGSFTIWPSAFGTGANIILNGACTPGNSGCLFSGFFARN
jgi:hypothetical protein